jgi:putative oxidoreductase
MVMTNLDSRLTSFSPQVLSLFRIVFGLMYTVHATQKLFDWPIAAPGPIPVGAWPFWWAGLIELIAGLLILTGFVTRVAAFVASGEMAFAYFSQHQPAGLWPIENGGELAVLYCFGFFLLVFTGGGAYALDAMRGGRRQRVRVRR